MMLMMVVMLLMLFLNWCTVTTSHLCDLVMMVLLPTWRIVKKT